MDTAITYNVTLIRHDAAARGWNDLDLAKRSGKNPATVSRFLAGLHQTPKTALAIALALGYKTPRRYQQPLPVGAGTRASAGGDARRRSPVARPQSRRASVASVSLVRQSS